MVALPSTYADVHSILIVIVDAKARPLATDIRVWSCLVSGCIAHWFRCSVLLAALVWVSTVRVAGGKITSLVLNVFLGVAIILYGLAGWAELTG